SQTSYYRAGARMVGAAGYLYAIGGYDQGKGQSETSVESTAIDPQSGALGAWHVVDASLPDRFLRGGAAVYGRWLYLAGGLSSLQFGDKLLPNSRVSAVAPLDALAQPLAGPVPTVGPTPTPTSISRIQAPPLESARTDWVPIGLTGKTVVQAVPDPSVAGRIYARASDGSYRSDDSGASWQSITDTLPFLARDPNDPNVAYETNHIQYGEDAFLRSADGGLTWSGVFTTTQSGYSVFYLGRISAVPPPPSGGSVPSLLSIYTAYGGYHVEGDGRRTYWSQDEGEFWQSADTPNLGWVSLAVSPVLPTTWAAVANSYQPPYFFDIPNPPRVPPALYRSQDAGATWTEISLSPVISNPVALAVDPVQADRFYLVSSDKVFLLDGVQRWVDMTGSLPSVTINSLALDYASPPNLLLGTTNGVWVRKLTYATSQGLFFPVGPGDPSLSSASIALFPSSGVSSTISWTASISPTVSWLSVVPASGSSLPVTVTVSADASGLTQSHYSSSIAFRVSGAAPSQDIETPVELYVGPVSRSYLPVVPEGIAAW
ncbi:MAG: hypothetical protein Q7R39_07215, partial [Dehalococcoidia bacterium]|nr:hypothetical protein [Dehalococcoidia bacterium]